MAPWRAETAWAAHGCTELRCLAWIFTKRVLFTRLRARELNLNGQLDCLDRPIPSMKYCAFNLYYALEVQEKMDRPMFDPAKCTVGGKNHDGCLYLIPKNAPPYVDALPPVSIQIVKSISSSTKEISSFVGGDDIFLQEILPLNYGSKM